MLLYELSDLSLAHVLQYLPPNYVLRLIGIGSVHLTRKLSRADSISLCWKSPEFYDWSRYASLIQHFTQLRSLLLTTWSPSLCPGQCLNVGTLPSNLANISLHFQGALELLIDPRYPQPFKRFESLSSLSLVQGPTLLRWNLARPTEKDCLDLDQFPSGLQHLELIGDEPSGDFYYDPKALNELPPDLQSLTLGMRAFTLDKKRFTIVLELNNLSLLDIYSASHITHEIKHMATSLTSLTIKSGRVEIDETTILVEPLGSTLPNLKLLHLSELGAPFDLGRFAELPPSLTIANFPFAHAHDTSALLKKLTLLNTARVAHKLDSYSRVPSAPSQLLEIGNNGSNIQAELLPAFTQIKVIRPAELKSIPLGAFYSNPTLQELNIRELDTRIFHFLPTSLTSLTCGSIGVREGSGSTPDLLLPTLKSFSLTSGSPSEWFLSLLPSSLKSLSLVEVDLNIMNVIGRRANEQSKWPLLEQLLISMRDGIRSQVTDASMAIMSLEKIPRTLKVLRITGSVNFPPHGPHTLLHHPNLLEFATPTACDANIIFQQMPPQLTRLSFLSSRPVSMSTLEGQQLIMSLATRFPKLLDLGLTGPWFATGPGPLPPLAQLRALPHSLIAFNLLRALPTWMISPSRRKSAAERVALSYLPPTISKFTSCCDQPIHWEDSPRTVVQRIFELTWLPWFLLFITSLLAYFLPIFGLLHNHREYFLWRHSDKQFCYPRYRHLPRNVSHFVDNFALASVRAVPISCLLRYRTIKERRSRALWFNDADCDDADGEHLLTRFRRVLFHISHIVSWSFIISPLLEELSGTTSRALAFGFIGLNVIGSVAVILATSVRAVNSRIFKLKNISIHPAKTIYLLILFTMSLRYCKLMATGLLFYGGWLTLQGPVFYMIATFFMALREL